MNEKKQPKNNDEFLGALSRLLIEENEIAPNDLKDYLEKTGINTEALLSRAKIVFEKGMARIGEERREKAKAEHKQEKEKEMTKSAREFARNVVLNNEGEHTTCVGDNDDDENNCSLLKLIENALIEYANQKLDQVADLAVEEASKISRSIWTVDTLLDKILKLKEPTK